MAAITNEVPDSIGRAAQVWEEVERCSEFASPHMCQFDVNEFGEQLADRDLP